MGMMAKSRHAAGFLLSFRSCFRKVMLGSQENMAVSASYHMYPVVCVSDIMKAGMCGKTGQPILLFTGEE